MVGAGFSGIGITALLLQDGHDVTVLERGDDVGGVWRDNSYPGAACDVPSHLYSFSFDPDGRWSKRFAERHEIYAYLQRVARDHGVTERVRFGTEVLRCTWDGDTWQLELSDGSTLTADAVVTGCGQLSRPSVPRIPQLDGFEGPVFHSAQWRHDVDLTGKRVLVIGTGASAIQFVPEVAKVAASVTVVQRSAPYVIPKPDRDYGPRTKDLLARYPLLLKADRFRTFATHEARSLAFNTEPRLFKPFHLRWQRFVEREVPDPALRARLVPDYTIGCKRILQSNDWYAALRQPHVTVTDTIDTTGIDVVVLGTGFAATDLLVPMEVVGTDGTLADAWVGGAEAYKGVMVPGFPNFFVLYGPNTNLGHSSIILMLESQFRFVRSALGVAGGGVVEVRREAHERWNAFVQRRLKRTVFAEGCDSWYLNAEGKNVTNWPGSTVEFRARLAKATPEDLVVTR